MLGGGLGLGLYPFPAGAGINRLSTDAASLDCTVPRRRGDQPSLSVVSSVLMPRSPQARGSTVPFAPLGGRFEPFPAGAGINRLTPLRSDSFSTVPRRRGDQPGSPARTRGGWSRSPQARGSTELYPCTATHDDPFPAGAGINRLLSRRPCQRFPVPRRRGDQPSPGRTPGRARSRSPQARGSTGHAFVALLLVHPFPAGAGINRQKLSARRCRRTVPRRRGDQPVFGERGGLARFRSPQARGSTAHRIGLPARRSPFPAGAGINRRHRRTRPP